jgi:hypothetical protein
MKLADRYHRDTRDTIALDLAGRLLAVPTGPGPEESGRPERQSTASPAIRRAW